MGKFEIFDTPLHDVFIIKPTVYFDDRGYFMETYNVADMKCAGLDLRFVQDNHSASRKGVLRGLHFQKEHPQGKLIRAVSGAVFDVAVDLRSHSGSFGKWFGTELSAENKSSIYIPEGFAHGFLALSDVAEVLYKVTDYYHPDDEAGILWNDPTLGIDWKGIKRSTRDDRQQAWFMDDGTPVALSEKDRHLPPFQDVIGDLAGR